ncbi:hypothetical protein [Kutzneria kofuensis]|uniref:Uncharacterized protein n=1 Tax=Kutzneria kofuensis TaxID=103725 RepID=A0A7W9KBT8_9PSEU|nr:hypothetical protein [Kutzneria kofuensis]MBB5889632.1 hypothetical protein [Kutzneria kofuensis]
MSGSFVRNTLLTVGAAVVAALTAFAPVAQAAGDPHAVTPQIQSLRAA